MREVWEVIYERADGVATAPLVALSVEYAAALVAALIDQRCTNVASVTVRRRPALPAEVPGG
jgi:hypothetical protein